MFGPQVLHGFGAMQQEMRDMSDLTSTASTIVAGLVCESGCSANIASVGEPGQTTPGIASYASSGINVLETMLTMRMRVLALRKISFQPRDFAMPGSAQRHHETGLARAHVELGTTYGHLGLWEQVWLSILQCVALKSLFAIFDSDLFLLLLLCLYICVLVVQGKLPR